MVTNKTYLINYLAKLKGVKKRFFFILKILISFLLGFLPSFLFVALFVQYGSPFSNYIRFLSNLDSSLGAWISALVIVLFVQFIFWFTHKKNFKKIIKNKVVLGFLILSFLIISSLIVLQFYLYLNFILRNDMLVKLSADKDNIFFRDNLKDEVNFKISVTMNPFCSAECKFDFFDISEGKSIETGQFNITSIFSKTKEYTLDNLHLTQGSQILNRFEVSCKSKKTLLCYTSEQESKRAVLITINYDLSDEDRLFKNNSKEEIISLLGMFHLSDNKLNESLINLNSINNSFSTEDLMQRLKNNLGSLFELNSPLDNLAYLWETQKFDLLKTELPLVQNEIQTFYSESENLSSAITSNISAYNNLTDELINFGKMLDELSHLNLNASRCTKLNEIVSDFNKAITQFKEESNLSDKIILVENISYEIEKFYNESQNVSGMLEICLLTEPISKINLTKIPIFEVDTEIPSALLNEPYAICCFFGKCEKCCDENCSGENYPVIFLHGYSMNKALPADYSLASFTDLKEKLTYEGYIDAGAVIISLVTEQKGLWGKVNTPITVTASYFFDTYKTEYGEKTVQSKTESIDTYAIRLKSIINLVKYRTNKDKVIIIAHSMGGLVTRRYIQILGGSDIDKIILISVPNHGIEDKVRDYCALLGPEVACRDMDKDGLFINKLDNSPTDIVPTYNIIGIGCNMGDETGDGIVKNSSQYLNYATNYYFNGTCNELAFDFFHESIADSDKHPEVYAKIRELLKN